ncbi:MAG: MFS transporter [Anaerolineaceae bacterium]|jgi:MFS family permease
MEKTEEGSIRRGEPKNMRTFFLIWTGQIVSMLGSSMTGFALGVWIFEQTGLATPFALVVLFSTLPRIALLPVAGSIADRWNRKAMMLIADSASAVTTLVIFLLVSSQQLQIWHVYLLAAVGSVFGAFQEPAYSASIVMLVPKKSLSRANGMIQLGQALEMVLSPVLAGIIFVAIGLRGVIMIDFVTYFFALIALLVSRIPQPAAIGKPDAGKKGRLWQDIRFGWQYLVARTGLFYLLLYFSMVNFLLNFAGVLMGPLILSRYSPAVFGSIQTVWGVGMLIGSIIMSSWKGPRQKVPVLIGCIALSSAGLAISGLRPSPLIIAAGMFFTLVFVPLASGMSQTIFQTKVAPEVQGRVFSMRAIISRAMMPIAYLLSGPLADQVFEPLMRVDGRLGNSLIGTILDSGPGRGVGLMFVLAGVAGVIVSGLVYRNRRVRMLEEELPDAEIVPAD